jgi:AhpD family alkylhydroperoxidase
VMEGPDATRLDWASLAPEVRTLLLDMEAFVAAAGLPRRLVELVKVRASQLNGCAYCLDMHTKEAREEGETEARLHLVALWRQAPHYSEAERVALDWTERLSQVPPEVPDDVFRHALATFGPNKLVALTAAVIAIGAWNRWHAAFRPAPVGSYRPRGTREARAET